MCRKLCRRLLLLLIFWTQFALAEKVQVQNVSDGDTLRVRYRGNSELLRLIGIDAPERHENPKAYEMAKRSGYRLKDILDLGERATNFLKSKVKRDDILDLEFDVTQRDKYGRLLAYAYLPDKEMLNTMILDYGFAHLLTMPPNIRYVDRLKTAYRNGRDLGRGLWFFPPFRDGERKEVQKKYSWK